MSSAKWRPFCLGLNVLTKSIRLIHAQAAAHRAQLSPNMQGQKPPLMDGSGKQTVHLIFIL